MKVLWFSNCVLSNDSMKETGTWLETMSRILVERGVELYNIAQKRNVLKVEKSNCNSITQWVVPCYKLRNGVPCSEDIKSITSIVNELDPDIIHIWGMESYWGLLFSRGYLKKKTLLEIQGYLYYYSDVFFGGLNTIEKIKCIGLKELLKPTSSIFIEKRHFKKWGYYENEMLNAFPYISTQSDWVRSHISLFANSEAKIYNTDINLRPQFLQSKPWEYKGKNKVELLMVSSGSVPYKGLHIVIKALSVLIKSFPDITLKVVGNFEQHLPNYRKTGYTKFVEKLISKLNLDRNVVFLGRMDSAEIVNQMLCSDVMIVPSFVETYCLTLAEAQAVGIPCVVSYAGSLPEIATDKKSALFYSPEDYITCADCVSKLIKSKDLALSLSEYGRQNVSIRNSPQRIGDIQMSIYHDIINDSSTII